MCCQLPVLRVGSVRIDAVVYVCLCDSGCWIIGMDRILNWYRVGVNTTSNTAKVSQQNRVRFTTEAEAQEVGYRLAGNCP